MSISKVLQEFGHAHWFTCCPWLLSCRGYLRENRWAEKPKIFAHWPLTEEICGPPALLHEFPLKSVWLRLYVRYVPLSSLLALDHGVSSTENCPSSLLSETLTLIYCSIELTKTLLQMLDWFLQKILWDDEAEISIILWRGNRCRVQSSIKDVGTRLT